MRTLLVLTLLCAGLALQGCSGHCAALTSCGECAGDFGCQWCGSSCQQLIDKDLGKTCSSPVTEASGCGGGGGGGGGGVCKYVNTSGIRCTSGIACNPSSSVGCCQASAPYWCPDFCYATQAQAYAHCGAGCYTCH